MNDTHWPGTLSDRLDGISYSRDSDKVCSYCTSYFNSCLNYWSIDRSEKQKRFLILNLDIMTLVLYLFLESSGQTLSLDL